MPPTAHAVSTSHGNVVSAAGKYDSSRMSVAAAPGGNHWPTSPHGARMNSFGIAAAEIGFAMSSMMIGPSAMPARPMIATNPVMGAAIAASASAMPAEFSQ